MKVATYTNSNGKLCTDGFDPDEDGYDAEAEEQREWSEQEALDDYMGNYFDDPDDLYNPLDYAPLYDDLDDLYDPLDRAPLYDDPCDEFGPLYPDE